MQEYDFPCSFSGVDEWVVKTTPVLWARGPERYAAEQEFQPFSSRELFSDWEGSIQPVIDQVITSLRKNLSYVLDIKGWEYLFSQWTRNEGTYIPRTLEYYIKMGIRLALTSIGELTKLRDVDGHGQEFLCMNNITNAWRAAYSLYEGGGVTRTRCWEGGKKHDQICSPPSFGGGR